MKTCKNCNEFENTHIGRAKACFGGMGTVFTPLEAAIHNPSQDTLPVRSAHTPLPLKFSNDATLRDADGMMVGQVVRRDQAKLIVHAVNHHAALIALTEDMADSYDRCQRIYARMVNETVSQVTVEEAERMLAHAVGRARSLVARAALQAAQEGKK